MSKRQPWKVLLTLAAALTLFATGYAYSQGTIAFVGDGIIHSKDGGFMFPDGTVQASAAAGGVESLEAIRRLSVNQGRYDNRIPEFTHSAAYVEICFVGGSILVDENDADDPTAGGSCEVGDVGWIIERSERTAMDWTAAKAECLKIGMRLPEVFEYQLTCDNAAMIGIIDMGNNYEWSSNQAIVDFDGHIGPVVVTLGNGTCYAANMGRVASTSVIRDSLNYRCAL